MAASDKRQQILDAASECLARYGYDKNTLDDIAGWPEISTTDLTGDGTDLSFSHTPGVTPFFLQVRED